MTGFPNPYMEPRKPSKGEKMQEYVSYVQMLARLYPSFRKLIGVKDESEIDSDRTRGVIMDMLFRLMSGGWFKGKRTQILGWVGVLGTVAYAFVGWLIGDVDFWGMLNTLKDNWELIAGGYLAIFVGDKIDDAKKT